MRRRTHTKNYHPRLPILPICRAARQRRSTQNQHPRLAWRPSKHGWPEILVLADRPFEIARFRDGPGGADTAAERNADWTGFVLKLLTAEITSGDCRVLTLIIRGQCGRRPN